MISEFLSQFSFPTLLALSLRASVPMGVLLNSPRNMQYLLIEDSKSEHCPTILGWLIIDTHDFTIRNSLAGSDAVVQFGLYTCIFKQFRLSPLSEKKFHENQFRIG